MVICHIAPFGNNPYHKKPISYEIKQKNGYEDIGECWECISHARDRDGYCQIKINNRQTKLHRFIYQYHYKDPGNLLVCHKCDNPSCINPDHLFLGTALDNNRDRSLKGRTSRVGNKGNCKGEMNGRAKLTENDVLWIKSQLHNGCSCKSIAEIFGVKRDAIGRIKNGKAWSHLRGVI